MSPEKIQHDDKNTSPCKSDDSESGYSSTNSFDENPKVEALVSDLNRAFMEKKCVSRESDNFKILRSWINRNLFVYVFITTLRIWGLTGQVKGGFVCN